MSNQNLIAVVAACLFYSGLTALALDEVRITEFAAVNDGPLTDEDGDFSDWIEIHNAGTNVVNLDGWSLTDNASDLTRWQFPATNLAPNAYLIVFASDKDRRVPGAPLHTNFRLAGGGEYLALVRPDGTNIASAYSPVYPPQVPSVSYGIPLAQVVTPLVPTGATARVLVPGSSLGTAWNSLVFDDSGWATTVTGVGYEADTQTPFVPATIADSVSEFSGVQGQQNWSYGYWDRKTDADGQYAHTEFAPFPNAGSGWSANNFWTGTAWDWFNGDPPFTQLTAQGGWPTGSGGLQAAADHWAVRRYICESNGPVKITGRVTHTGDWVYVTQTGVASSSLLYIYLLGPGEGYIDDLKLVAGFTPEVGANLIANGDFEGNLNPSWNVSVNLAGSAITTAIRHAGNRSLKLVSTDAGSTQTSAIWQLLNPAIPASQICTLSYWYLPATNSPPLIVRFSQSWIETTPEYCSDGVVARVFVDGTEVLAEEALVSSTDYSVTVPAQAGSRIDFAIDPGANFDGQCDGTIFTATVRTEDPNLAIVADSVADWSFSGTQGENNWFNGYYNKTADTNSVPTNTYHVVDFVPFPRNNGPYGPNNFWDGRSWDWWNGDPPFDEIGQLVMHPTGLNNNVEHWVIRRWVSEVSGSITVDWSLNKIEASGAGVTMRVFQNGTQRDFLTLPGTNYSIIKRSIVINNVQQGDFIDIAMDPQGFGGGFGDGGDRSLVSVVIRGRPTLTSQIASNLETAMRNVNATAYVRIPFSVSNPAAIEFLTLRMKYDDGFVAYLNGVPVASANAPLDPAWNSSATGSRTDADARQFQEFNLTPVRSLLQMGVNVLAIQGLNASASDLDFLVLPELLATSITFDPAVARYFSAQTPGAANGYGGTNVGPIIRDVSHTPNVPRDNESLVVTAAVRPTFNPIGGVRLVYRVMDSNEVTTPMFDDGLHGDGSASDGVYGGTIPASASTPGQMVRYSIAASDTATNESRFPPFEDPKNSPQYQGTVVLDLSLTNPLPVLHMFVQNPVLATNEVGTRCSIFYDGEFYDNVGVNLHGQTTAAVFSKRSMNIDLNPGHRFRWSRNEDPVDDFNLLTPIADKAYVRQIMAWETFVNAGVPAHFAFPVRVQQNNAFFGVFYFVERGDDNFLDRLGLDPNGALYKVYLPLTDAYGGVAEKKTRRSEPNDDLQALINGCSLSGTPGRQYLYDNVDVPEVVNFLATLQLVQNEDCCYFKNYYLYRDTTGTGLWQMMPWDLDLVFGRTFNFFVLSNQTVNGYFDTNIYWTNSYQPDYNQQRAGGNFIGKIQPVLDAIISSSETAEMFYRRWTSVQEEFLQRTNTHPHALKFERRIDELSAQIGPDAALDFAKWGNWFPQQTMSVAVQVLKTEYFARRRGWIFNTLAFANGGPYLGPQPTNAVVHFGAIEFNPSSGNQAQEYIQLTNANTYAVDMSGWRLGGAVDYTFRPGVVIPPRSALYVSPDQKAFRARTSGPGGGQGLFVQGNYQGQLSARGEVLELIDRTGRVVRGTNYAGNPSLAQRYLRITELMYHPAPSSGSTTNGDDFEFIELKNTGPTTLSLSGVRLVSGVEFSFTGSAVTSLAGGESVLVVRNLAAFTVRYGAGFNIAGEYTGALDNGGENVRLDDATGEKILDFDYDNAWYPITDGNGFSLVIVSENAAWDTWSLKSSWRPSGVTAGSPAQTDPPAPTIAPILVNEVLTHTDPPTVDAIELFNPTAGDVNIGGWYLSDDFLTPRKFRIPNGTTIAAGGYVIFTEANFNPTNPPTAASFAFSSNGDEAYLFSADGTGNLTGYFHGFDFGAAENTVSFGRHVTSLLEEHFVAQSVNTFGTANAGPKVGPVVISEIMFHPPDFAGGEDNQLDEFIELRNNTTASVALYDFARPTNTWHLRGAVQFDFPASATLAANSRALVVSFDPADAGTLVAFRAHYGVPASIPVFGPYLGKLDNSDESLALFKPDPPDFGVPYVLVDRVDYQSLAPWPSGADGTGASLQRRNVLAYGNDPVNWAVGAPTAGQPFVGGTPPVITLQPANQVVVAFMNATFSVGVSGTAPFQYQWQLDGTNIPNGTNAIFVVPRVLPLATGVVAVTVFNGAGAVSSSNALFTTLLPAYITQHPTNSLVRVAPDPAAPANPTASFNVAAVSPTPIRYQWRFNGMDLPGATSPTLTITNVQLANEGAYTALAIDSVGAMESNPAYLIPLVSPTIVQGLIPQSVLVGSPFTLSVVATGRPLPFSYEWRRGSFTVASNTVNSDTDFFTFIATNVPMTNTYRVIVRNLANQTTTANSAAAVVTVTDSDGDGMADGWEISNGLNPANAADADLDGDGDGMSNRAEYVAGTDPANPSSYLRVESIAVNGGATLEFNANSNRTYSVLFTDALESGVWQKLADVPARSGARLESVADPDYVPNRFYRLSTPRNP